MTKAARRSSSLWGVCGFLAAGFVLAAVTSANCVEPYRPMPVPYIPLMLASTCLWNRGTEALTPNPPPVFESLYANAAEGAVRRAPVLETQNPELIGLPTRMLVCVALVAVGLRTAQG